VLLGLFALGLTVGTGLKSALNYSVFAASAGALALATERSYRWSLDALLASRVRGEGEAFGRKKTAA
jgi:thiosulfate dehydrogenase (quinone) large subunit